MLNVIDTATPQRNLNFQTAYNEGWQSIYVKMGGFNVSPIYVAPYYTDQINKSYDVGMNKIGSYWVPGRSPARDQANWMADRLHRWDPNRCFIVLDNETLDDGLKFADEGCAEFIEVMKSRLGIPGEQVLTYSGLNDARNTTWTHTLATGTNFIIAAYSYPPMQLPDIPTIPRDRIVGHQFGGKAIGGVITDTNAFTDNAFNFGSGGGGTTGMYNPFSGWRVTGTWEDHASYSAGGTDYPLANGTALPAPASGNLRVSGGSGEFAAGFVGSAGRRSILELDTPLARQQTKRSSPPEGDGPMVAVVFQHQSSFGYPKHYSQKEVLGWSGNSNGTASGGDYHLHIHGLNARGQRLRFESFVNQSSPAGGGGVTPIEDLGDLDMGIMILAVDDRKGRPWRYLGDGFNRVVPDAHVDIIKGVAGKVLEVNSAQYDIILANFVQTSIGADTPVVAKAFDPALLIAAVVKAIDEALADATVSSEITASDKTEIADLVVKNFVESVGFKTL